MSGSPTQLISATKTSSQSESKQPSRQSWAQATASRGLVVDDEARRQDRLNLMEAAVAKAKHFNIHMEMVDRAKAIENADDDE